MTRGSTQSGKANDFFSALISSLVAILVTAAFALSSDQLHHWFIIPVLFCGALAGIDAIDWLRGRVQPFDPLGLIGIYCTFAFFIAPLLHVKWDYWMSYVTPPDDWRNWLGSMAVLNCIGLLAYRTAVKLFSTPDRTHGRRWVWRADPRGFRIATAMAMAGTLVLQVWVYRQYGGISGYISAFHEEAGAFDGMGWIFMICESFPTLVAFAFIVYATSRRRRPTWLAIGVAMVFFVGLQMLFGGLRGSRSNTIFRAFWVVGAIHFVVRPMPKRLLFAGIVPVVAFMYMYGFYKSHADLEAAFEGEASDRERITQRTGRSLAATVLEDFGRADVQAYVLYKLMTDPRDYSYAKGRTYLFALTLMIPKWLLPARPASKEQEGAYLLWGPGTYEPGVWGSSRVFGLAGEAMMNFSPLSIPLTFGLLGFAVARVRAWIGALQPGDLRFLLAPFAVFLCFIAISSDADNIVFNAMSKGFVPTLVILASASRLKIIRLPRLRIPRGGELNLAGFHS